MISLLRGRSSPINLAGCIRIYFVRNLQPIGTGKSAFPAGKYTSNCTVLITEREFSCCIPAVRCILAADWPSQCSALLVKSIDQILATDTLGEGEFSVLHLVQQIECSRLFLVVKGHWLSAGDIVQMRGLIHPVYADEQGVFLTINVVELHACTVGIMVHTPIDNF